MRWSDFEFQERVPITLLIYSFFFYFSHSVSGCTHNSSSQNWPGELVMVTFGAAPFLLSHLRWIQLWRSFVTGEVAFFSMGRITSNFSTWRQIKNGPFSHIYSKTNQTCTWHYLCGLFARAQCDPGTTFCAVLTLERRHSWYPHVAMFGTEPNWNHRLHWRNW